MLITAAILLALDFVVNKIYQKLEGTSPQAGLAFNSLLGLFTAVVFFIINGFKIEVSGYSFVMAASVSCFVMGYNMIGFRLLKSGTMAMYTLFLMTGGMIIPYILGFLFLNEPCSIARTIGLTLILAGIILSNFSNQKINFKQIAMCIAVFVLNGFVSIISKLHQIESDFDTINAAEFVILSGIFKFILAGILYMSVKKTEKIKSANYSRLAILFTIAASAVAGGISYLLQLWGAASLPATVLYPFVTGGSIVFSALAGMAFFKEKLSKKQIGGIMFCFLGTIMFL